MRIIITNACVPLVSYVYESQEEEADFVLGFSQRCSESGGRISNSKSVIKAAAVACPFGENRSRNIINEVTIEGKKNIIYSPYDNLNNKCLIFHYQSS
mgnify:CR=1 FL=1